MVETIRAILQVMLTTFLSVELIIGMLGNAFIALVNIVDWVKTGKLSAVDQILTALAISRIVFLLILFTMILVSVLYPASMETLIRLRMAIISWTVTNHFSIWLATCLSIFYFLKIANFSNSIFLDLKWKAKRVVSVTLLLSLIILFINIRGINIFIDILKVNTSYKYISNNIANINEFPLFTNAMFSFIPFSVTLITFLLLIFSLWRHLKNMQHSTKGSRDVSTTAHIKALQMVVAFLLLYTGFVVTIFLQSWIIHSQHKILAMFFIRSIGIAFPSGHSCVLILGNNKLRQASLSVLWWLRCKYRPTQN